MLNVLRRLSSRQRQMAGAALIFIVLQVWLDLRLPDYMSTITTLVTTEDSAMSEVLKQGGYMLACALGSLVCAVVVGYLAARIAAGLARTLREEVFNHSLAFSDAEVGRFSAPSLINRATNDVTQIQNVIAMGMQAVVKAPILAVWAILKIADKAWEWTTATGVAVIVLCMMLGVIIAVAIPRFQRIQGLTDVLGRVSREQLTGIRVVRAYNAEAYQERKFADANDDLTGNNLVANRVMAIMSPGMTFISSTLTLSVYAIGAHLVEAAAGPQRVSLFADMVVFSNYAMQVVMAFMLLTLVFILLPRAQVSARRITEVLSTRPSVADAPRAASPGQDAAAPGTVTFENVSFRYAGAGDDALTGISFTAAPGQTVAFIGATGSGKSTLVNLVPRLADVTAGRVLVDGRDVRDYSLHDLRGRIGYVPQRAYLFSGTVASNVAYPRGDELTEQGRDAVEQALETAQASGFVAEMEGGADATITQGGTNVSGGQRQRLSIARALAASPGILIFDDSFSALDYTTDRALRRALARRDPRATTLVVAQRIGTIRDADQIIVLEHGRVVGQGTHAELLATCPTYQEIASSQLSKEELRA
ncbi:ABC transporter ATP-binding protein [Actinomyces sp. HMT897]|uniref:ABC transporter ATP-binding protein n=1 Tax=Actinomyces sp. HMT897 TaxID=2789424 RepID=UPI00190E512C|nr:ABC transporter ATP-binding protein [Actinomyces sp. HMT897]QQO77845.1 ABC transporter ATP-binding protein [Actinomyces sp. HMT897]